MSGILQWQWKKICAYETCFIFIFQITDQLLIKQQQEQQQKKKNTWETDTISSVLLRYCLTGGRRLAESSPDISGTVKFGKGTFRIRTKCLKTLAALAALLKLEKKKKKQQPEVWQWYRLHMPNYYFWKRHGEKINKIPFLFLSLLRSSGDV